MAGIKDVAALAGVSIATVSRVMNGHEGIAAQKQQAVLDAAEKLGYARNNLAAHLRRKSSNTIGVLLARQGSPFGATLHTAIESALAERGYLAMVCSSQAQPQREMEYIRKFLEMQVRGVIIRPSSSLASAARHTAMLERAGIPVVYVETAPREIRKAGSVMSDNYAGGVMAIERLHALGHSHIALLVKTWDRRGGTQNPMNMRLQGALDTAQKRGIGETVFVEHGHDGTRFDFGVNAMNAILLHHPEVTAVMTTTDLIGIGAIMAIRQAGLDVPGDISVLGYDGIAMSEMTLPPLATIDQHIAQMGRKAVDLLIERLPGQNLGEGAITLSPDLKERASIGPVRERALLRQQG